MGGKWRIVLVAVIAAAALVSLTFAAKATVGLDWFIAFATVGTAIGTLGLAFYTYRLAATTRESVSEANRLTDLAYSQLKEVQAQRDLIAEQAEKAGLQAEATRRLADASETSALEAARARIDAIAPLVHMEVSLLQVEVTTRGLGNPQALLQASDQWYEAQLRDLIFTVTLNIRLENVGASPALLAFGDTSASFEGVTQRGIYSTTLAPDGRYQDRLVLRYSGDEAKNGALLNIPVTYNGLLYGEMFDRVQWRGQVVPLLFADGIARANDRQWIINSSGAQVIRSYPNLERPAEMDEAKTRLLEQPS